MINKPLLVTVIIVTYNPRRDLLAWALDSLEIQTLPKDHFEVVVVDNNSSPPLQLGELTAGRTINLRLVQEPRQGNTYARSTGITEAKAKLLIFVDDDNHLDSDYLEQSLLIAREHPEIGAFGGIARGVFESSLKKWQKELVPSLGVRDYGPEPITSREKYWGPWEPIGAGMVFRRDVGLAFVDFLSRGSAAQALGRKGTKLMSGEDALLVRLAYQIGYACSYQPSLRIDHHMKRERFRFRNLCHTLEGHGRSEAILYQLLYGQDIRAGLPHNCFMLLAGLVVKILTKGLWAGYVAWQWDLGYWREKR